MLEIKIKTGVYTEFLFKIWDVGIASCGTERKCYLKMNNKNMFHRATTS